METLWPSCPVHQRFHPALGSVPVSTVARVFLARLAGVGVFDPNGDQLGRVREAVATLRIGRQQPRVLGLVVELQHRHRIFVPMGRVTRLESDAVVLSTASVNLKRFQRRPAELLVLAELLGKKNVKNYDGSWTEYGSLIGVPVAVGP